jgi:FAD synthetase
MSLVLVTGTFDGLHPGHEDLFRQAKEQGDRLVVVVARDATVTQVKGRPPRVGEDERRKTVEASSFVDQAVLGRDGDKLAVIADLKPDVIVLGYDQEAFTGDLEARLTERGVVAKIVRAKPFHPEKYKSSLMASQAEK